MCFKQTLLLQHSDMVLWPTSTKLVYVVELIVPWGGGVHEAYKIKKTHHSELPIGATQNRWKIKILLVEVGCRGFVAISTTS